MKNKYCPHCGSHLDTGFNCPNGCKESTIKKPFTCPICNGLGQMQKLGYISGDQHMWISSGIEFYQCNACKGTGIIWGTL